jgi:hypothetical protein
MGPFLGTMAPNFEGLGTIVDSECLPVDVDQDLTNSGDDWRFADEIDGCEMS